jgi:uncharacterized protein involved in outer membrane biogenesis
MRIRTILLVCAGLVGVLVIAGLVFFATFDPNQYKGLIEAKAREATGRELAIKGPIRLSLSLRPTLIVEDLTFANMAGGARPEMVTAKRLEIALEIMPLITQRQIAVDSLKLSGADLLLEIDRTGHANWQFGPAAPSAPSSAAANAPSQPARGPMPIVRSIAIADSTIAYRDDATGKERTLSIGRLQVSPGASIIPIDAAGALDAVPFEIKGSVGAGVLAGAQHFPVTLSGRVLGFDLAIDGELGQTFKAKISAGDLKPLGTALGSALPDIGAVKIDTTIAGPLTAPVLNPLTIAIGDTELAGDVAVKLGGARPSVAANLTSKRLDLAAFTGGKKAAATPPADAKNAGGKSAALFSTSPLPFDVLKAVDASLKLEVASLALSSVTLEGVSATVTLANGLLTAKPVAAGIAGGHMTFDLALDAAHQTLSIDMIGQQIATDQLLKELGFAPYLTAKADLSAKLNGHGDSAHAIASSLAGTSALTVGPGALAGSLIQSGLGEAVKLIAPGGGNEARLTCAVAHFDLANGVATPHPLVIETSDIIVGGSGTIDLGREMLDLKMTPRPLSASLGKFAVPFRIAGPLTAPSIQPDAAGIAETAASIASGSSSLKPLAGLLPFGGAGTAAGASGNTAAAGCAAPAAAAPAAAGAAPAAPSAAPAAKPSPGQLLNNLGRALTSPGR